MSPRIIDANSNRAREALRTIEELARFVLGDAGLTEHAKAIRHRLTMAVADLPFDHLQLLASRDTPGDVGTRIEGRAELTRPDTQAVAAAAASRLTESLRVLEESAKLIGPVSAATELESCRYESYELARRIGMALGRGGTPQWRLCVLLTESLCVHHPWDVVARRAIAGGADCLQLREKSMTDSELAHRAAVLVALCRGSGLAVIINDRPDVALAVGADGVHLGQTDLPVEAVRRIAGRRLIVGVSTENATQARKAFDDGADYCGVGPMFPTTTKQKSRIAGLEYLREYVALTGSRPYLAVGGVNVESAPLLAAAGCRGVAVSSAVCGATDPESMCRNLLEILSKTVRSTPN